MRKATLAASILSLVLSSFAFAANTPTLVPVEDWKGGADSAAVHLGGLVGLGILDSQAGLTLMGTASKKIIPRGFISDINDSVSIEAQAGPLWTQSTMVFHYSFHIRWDFQKDAKWTLYALAGLAGDVTGSSLGNRFILLPRFGIGSFYRWSDHLLLRGEWSRELMAVGVSIPF